MDIFTQRDQRKIIGLGYRLTVRPEGCRLVIEGRHLVYSLVIAVFVGVMSFGLLLTPPFRLGALIPLAVVWLIGLTLVYILPPSYRIEAERTGPLVRHSINSLVFKWNREYQLEGLRSISSSDDDGEGVITFQKGQTHLELSRGLVSHEAARIKTILADYFNLPAVDE